MLDKDKIWVVFYINVSKLDYADVGPYMEHVRQAFLPHDESVEMMFIPVFETETHVDCINPVLLTAEKYKETEQMISAMREQFENALKDLKEE